MLLRSNGPISRTIIDKWMDKNQTDFPDLARAWSRNGEEVLHSKDGEAVYIKFDAIETCFHVICFKKGIFGCMSREYLCFKGIDFTLMLTDIPRYHLLKLGKCLFLLGLYKKDRIHEVMIDLEQADLLDFDHDKVFLFKRLKKKPEMVKAFTKEGESIFNSKITKEHYTKLEHISP